MSPTAKEFGAKEGDTLVEWSRKGSGGALGGWALEGRHFKVLGFTERQRQVKRKGLLGFLGSREETEEVILTRRSYSEEGTGYKSYVFWADSDWEDIIRK